jgi:hypothetical protein
VELIESKGEVMDGTVITALVSGAVASVVSGAVSLGVVELTYHRGKRRDHEADWRKLKLEQYKEYIAALSGTVHHPSEAAVQQRYSDAFNSMALVAPQKVLAAMYVFNDEISKKNQERSLSKYEFFLSSLMRTMRDDCHATEPKDDPKFIFHTITC